MKAKVYHTIIKCIDNGGREFFTWVDVDMSLSISYTLEDVEKYALNEVEWEKKEVVGVVAISPENFGKCIFMPWLR